jgi:hypothetical protein
VSLGQENPIFMAPGQAKASVPAPLCSEDYEQSATCGVRTEIGGGAAAIESAADIAEPTFEFGAFRAGFTEKGEQGSGLGITLLGFGYGIVTGALQSPFDFVPDDCRELAVGSAPQLLK